MINYNSPEHQNERANVVPLSMEEIQELVKYVNDNHKTGLFEDVIQRFIYHYENMQHMVETVPAWIDTENNIPEQYKEVLCIDNYGDMYIDFIDNSNHWHNSFPVEPKYWQALPKPPTK